MTVSAVKLQELKAVVNFWKFRVDETKRHLDQLVARQSTRPDAYIAPLIEMKTRELNDSQRGLRRAQASLGRLLETTGDRDPVMDIVDEPLEADELRAADAANDPAPEPAQAVVDDVREAKSPARGRAPFTIGEFNGAISPRPAA